MTQATVVAELCRYIEGCEEPPTLDQLAARAGWSRHHTHRVFRKVTGLTPKAYAEGCRGERMRAALGGGETSVTEAIYAAGYSSSSRFYERADATLGMPARRYRAGGAGERIAWAVRPCSLGFVLVGATERGVCLIQLGDSQDELAAALSERFPKAERVRAPEDLGELLAMVVELVEDPGAGPGALPLDVRGTAFQQLVWDALRKIPPGETVTYAGLAEAIGRPGSARAVAGACAANRLAVAIPCHRVIRGDGSLAGYRWGVERKRTLLSREG